MCLCVCAYAETAAAVVVEKGQKYHLSLFCISDSFTSWAAAATATHAGTYVLLIYPHTSMADRLGMYMVVLAVAV